MIQFGTEGWRAIIGDGFTKTSVQCVAAALAQKMKEEGVAVEGVVVGYDRQLLSGEASRWAAEVFAGEGILCRVIDRTVPTSLIMHTVKCDEPAYGLAITAGRHPAIYNGVKLFTQGGRDADEMIAVDLEEYIRSIDMDKIETISFEEGVHRGIIEIIRPLHEYIDNIIRGVNMSAIRSRGLTVALEPLFDVVKTALQTILLTARCEVDILCEHKGALSGGHLPDPSEKTLSELINLVKERRSDVGIATDGGRLGVVNDCANFSPPGDVLALLYYYLIKYKGWRGAVVRSAATTHLLDRMAHAFGEICYEVPEGFGHINAKMAETNALIGGDSSGGLAVRGHIQGKDGIYATILLVEMIAVTGRKLSEIHQEIMDLYGESHMMEYNFCVSEEGKREIMKKLMEDRELPDFAAEIERICRLDGCKVHFKNGGWILLRFFDAEPFIRVFCEMPTEEEARVAGKRMVEFLKLM